MPSTARDPGAPCILLAEDDDSMRALLVRQLRAEGYAVIEARDGADLVGQITRTARRHPAGRAAISVVVSDVRMPRLSGIDVLTALRCADWDTPVILFTAFGSQETHDEARSLGASAVLDKPFEFEELRDRIRAVLAGVPPSGPAAG